MTHLLPHLRRGLLPFPTPARLRTYRLRNLVPISQRVRWSLSLRRGKGAGDPAIWLGPRRLWESGKLEEEHPAVNWTKVQIRLAVQRVGTNARKEWIPPAQGEGVR